MYIYLCVNLFIINFTNASPYNNNIYTYSCLFLTNVGTMSDWPNMHCFFYSKTHITCNLPVIQISKTVCSKSLIIIVTARVFLKFLYDMENKITFFSKLIFSYQFSASYSQNETCETWFQVCMNLNVSKQMFFI